MPPSRPWRRLPTQEAVLQSVVRRQRPAILLHSLASCWSGAGMTLVRGASRGWPALNDASKSLLDRKRPSGAVHRYVILQKGKSRN